jgi:hypothetical protein
MPDRIFIKGFLAGSIVTIMIISFSVLIMKPDGFNSYPANGDNISLPALASPLYLPAQQLDSNYGYNEIVKIRESIEDIEQNFREIIRYYRESTGYIERISKWNVGK